MKHPDDPKPIPQMIAKDSLSDEQRMNVATNLDHIAEWLDAAETDLTAHLIAHNHDPDDPMDRVCCGLELSRRLARLDLPVALMALQMLMLRHVTGKDS